MFFGLLAPKDLNYWSSIFLILRVSGEGCSSKRGIKLDVNKFIY